MVLLASENVTQAPRATRVRTWSPCSPRKHITADATAAPMAPVSPRERLKSTRQAVAPVTCIAARTALEPPQADHASGLRRRVAQPRSTSPASARGTRIICTGANDRPNPALPETEAFRPTQKPKSPPSASSEGSLKWLTRAGPTARRIAASWRNEAIRGRGLRAAACRGSACCEPLGARRDAGSDEPRDTGGRRGSGGAPSAVCVSARAERLAGGCEAVAPEAAVGLVGEGHLDEAERDGGLLVLRAEVLLVVEAQRSHERGAAHGAIERADETTDLGGAFEGHFP